MITTRSPAVISGLVYNCKAQVLITEGEATGGKMQYALGEDATTEPTENWSTSIPTATEAGTYYVWYKVVGDANHSDSAAKCVTVTISKKEESSSTTTETTATPITTTTPITTPAPKTAVPTSQQEKITIMKAPVLKKLRAKKNKVQVTWNRIKKNKAGKKLLAQIKYIEVQVATDPEFKAIVATRGVGKKKTKATLMGLQRKTVYYVRVRYVGADGVSKWSKVKKVKTK